MDVSHRALETAKEKLHLDRMPESRRSKLKLLHGSLTYRDARLAGFDGAAVVEVIEHLDPPRLEAFQRAVFEFAKPRVVVITTPNVEYNVRFDMGPRTLRHPDHRFEWTRAEFRAWAERAAAAHGYEVTFDGIGPADEEVGSPTQMAIFAQ